MTMPGKKTILILTAVFLMAPPLSAAQGISAAADTVQDSNGAGSPVSPGAAGLVEDTASADTDDVPRTVVPRFSADSALGEKNISTDSAWSTAQTDTAGLADTAVTEDTSFFELSPVTVAFADSAEREPERLYPGVSPEQHLLARRMLDFFFDAEWDSSGHIEKELMRLEKKHGLPPLSALLTVGIRVLRVLHGDYGSDRIKKGLLKEIDKVAARGLELADPGGSPDPCRATDLLITGGIQGFTAALEIDRNPINAAINGLSSLKSLKKAAELDTLVRDAYLGVAMYHCIMSRAPALVRGTLALVGKQVSLEKGLEYMRVCAYGGRYTNEVAQLCLIEFLSPYLGHEAREKQLILNSLQQRYPHNPFFVFLEFDEDLCFHPENLTGFSFKDRIQQQITQFTMSNPSSQCYANLVKWQYLLVDPFPSDELAPDKEFMLRRYSYYPVFLQAVREKIVGGSDSAEAKTDHARRLRFIRAMGARAERMLDASNDMPQNRKGLYLWHIRDALRVTEKQ
jgi:hypothetical protein